MATEDFGYGAGPDDQGNSNTVYNEDYWTKHIQYLMSNGYPVDQIAKDFLATPDDYFVNGSGGLTKKTWLNQHQGLATILFAAAPFVGGGLGSLAGGGSEAGSVAADFIDPGIVASGGGTAAVAAPLASTAITLPAASTVLPSSVATGAGAAAPEAAAGAIPHFVGPTAVGTAPAGGFTPAIPAAAGAAPLASTQISLPPDSTKLPQGGSGKLNIVGNTPSYKEIADLLKAAGQGVGSADSAAQNNQMVRANAQLLAAKGMEDAYMSDATLEDKQRRKELQDTYRQGVVSSGQKSPFNPVSPNYGADYLASTAALSGQGRADLEQAPVYGIRNIPKPTDIYPDPKTAYAETGMQKVGDWLGPGLSIAGSIPPSVYSKIFSWL